MQLDRATVTGRRDEHGGPQVGLSKGKQRTDPQTCNQPHVSAKASAYTSSKVSGVNSGQMRFSVMEELVGEDNMSETFEMLKNKIRSITGPSGHPHGKASKPVNKGRKGQGKAQLKMDQAYNNTLVKTIATRGRHSYTRPGKG